MSGLNADIVAELYGDLKYVLCTASAALFFNGICLLLFVWAIFFLQKTKSWTSRMFLGLSVILVLFALAQAALDVASPVIFLRLTQTVPDGSPEQAVLYHTYLRLFLTRAALTAVNNAIADCLFLYRCAAIWGSSPYYRLVIAVPAVLVLLPSVYKPMGFWAIFGLTTNTPIPFSFALGTNFLLLALTAGRIWNKSRQVKIVLGIEAGHRYDRILEILSESSLLYVIVFLVYLIMSGAHPVSPITGIAWGALGQVVNIVPMMIMVRVGMIRSSDERWTNLHVFYGGNAVRDDSDF
ncbi:hypothetical protein B0H14DRAFT_3429265 [Mycena olivaceomarginata]|nr:hypothetical protein B0H14DRAFT_3429265 [Mycena olivaceomarginata]